MKVTGPELRKFRWDQNWNQERLADLLEISKSYLQALESSPEPVPDRIAERFSTLRRALATGAVMSDTDKPRRRFPDFHRSLNFSQEPPFASLPACPCGDARCRLSPVTDRERDGQHLWKFKGTRCVRIRYVDARGKIAPIPRELSRDPLLQKPCSQCGRLRQLDRRYRSAIGGNVVTLHCVPQAGDPAGQKHDPPERFIERNGRVRRLTDADADKLRGRSRTEFPVPVCKGTACPRRDKRMEHTADLVRTEKSRAIVKIAMYACRPPKPAPSHYEYRVRPRGEVALPIVDSSGKRQQGRYRWTDATGEAHETVRKERVRRKDRVMPGAKCPRHGDALDPRRGPWRRGQVKHWLAVCPKDGERFHVREDGSVAAPAKGGRRKRGPQPGKLSKSTLARITIAADLLVTDPTATEYSMAGTLFPEQNFRDAAYENAKKLFQRHKKRIENERTRLEALSRKSRSHEVEQAKQRLSSRDIDTPSFSVP